MRRAKSFGQGAAQVMRSRYDAQVARRFDCDILRAVATGFTLKFGLEIMAICPHCQTIEQEFLTPCPTGDGYFCVEEKEFQAHSDDPLLGQQIAGRFIVVGVAGHGSMGYVYRAIQGQVDRPVALKIFRPDYLNSANGQAGRDGRALAQQRFEQEARVLGRLSHPNCVTLYDFGVSEHGDFLYIAMEYVGGVSMRKAVRRGLKLKPILEITRQVLLALSEAHALDIVHRDLKPENIMLAYRASTDEQVVKVLDFGIAKLLGQNTDAYGTSTGLLFGTPAYMSPEQCRGDIDAIGPASDIYALGCMLYEMLSGHLPYPSNVAQEMVRMHQDSPIPPLSARPGVEVPAALESFVRKCMAKQPEQRYPNAKFALRAFEEAVDITEAAPGSRPGARGELYDTGNRKVVVPRNRILGTDEHPFAGNEDSAALTGQASNSPSASFQRPDPVLLAQQSAVATVYGQELAAVNLTPASTSIKNAQNRAERSRTVLLMAALMGVALLCVLVFYYIYRLVAGA